MRIALLVSTSARFDDPRGAAEGRRPMPDYLALEATLRRAGHQVALIDRGEAACGLTPRAHSLALRAGRDMPQAILAARSHAEYDRFVCDSEAIGLPLAALLRAGRVAPGVYFIAHHMTTRGKQALWRWMRLGTRVAGAFCYADTQRDCLRRLRLAEERLYRMPFHADTRFYTPAEAAQGGGVLSVGQERRDYATLVAAARGLSCPVRILATSPWSRHSGGSVGPAVPPNVSFLTGVPYPELRALYARAAVVAVPVEPVDFQAGITSLLEAMAMARPVVATANPGLREVFRDGEAGIWVPPGDVAAMGSALGYLLRNPETGAAMGRRGRALVERGMTLDHWVERVAQAVLTTT